MTIAVDGNDANVAEKVGVSVYTSQLLFYFHKKADDSLKFSIYLRAAPGAGMPDESAYFTYKVVAGPRLWSQVFLPFQLFTHRRSDVFFSPAHYTPRFSPSPVVVTVHDLAYEYYPNEFLKSDLYKLKSWTNYAVNQSRKVIAVSANTKKDLVKFYKVPEDKITVIHNGFEKKVQNATPWPDIEKKFKIIKNKYVLYVGTLQPRKNIPSLIKAFEMFSKENKDFKLILVGKKGWLYDRIVEATLESPESKNIILTGYLPDEEVVSLYRNAYCFVLPSLYEGFGVPILEAMAQGCPVLSSFTSSLPEIGGDACLYFDPQKIDGIYDDLEQLKNYKLRQELIQKGKERIKHFSWETCATETLKVLQLVCNSN